MYLLDELFPSMPTKVTIKATEYGYTEKACNEAERVEARNKSTAKPYDEKMGRLHTRMLSVEHSKLPNKRELLENLCQQIENISRAKEKALQEMPAPDAKIDTIISFYTS